MHKCFLPFGIREFKFKNSEKLFFHFILFHAVWNQPTLFVFPNVTLHTDSLLSSDTTVKISTFTFQRGMSWLGLIGYPVPMRRKSKRKSLQDRHMVPNWAGMRHSWLFSSGFPLKLAEHTGPAVLGQVTKACTGNSPKSGCSSLTIPFQSNYIRSCPIVYIKKPQKISLVTILNMQPGPHGSYRIKAAQCTIALTPGYLGIMRLGHLAFFCQICYK